MLLVPGVRSQLTHLADDVGLELAGEDGVDDAVAVGGVDLGAAGGAAPDEVAVQQVQRRDEELVRVLLLVP